MNYFVHCYTLIFMGRVCDTRARQRQQKEYIPANDENKKELPDLSITKNRM